MVLFEVMHKKMNILIVYAHPEPTSFNAAMKDMALRTLESLGYDVKISDLYAQKFNPVAGWSDFRVQPVQPSPQYGVMQREAYLDNLLNTDIKEEQDKLKWCNSIVLQFPLWWFGMPAILKGWFDRVFTAGFAFDKDKLFDKGLLHPRKALVSVTTQSPESAYQNNGIHGPMDIFLKPIHHTFRFTGIFPLMPFIAYGVTDKDAQSRSRLLQDYHDHLISQFKHQSSSDVHC